MSNFKGRLEMQEDLERVSRQLRLDRLKKVREREIIIASEKSELYRHFIEESKRQRLLEKKKLRAVEISSNLQTLNNQWCLALSDAGAAHREAHIRVEQANKLAREKQEAERRRKEAADRRTAIAHQKLRDEEVKRKHKEREILILKQLRDQERWATREDAHAFGEMRQVQESVTQTAAATKLTKQSAESLYHRFPTKIIPKVIRHGITPEEHVIVNNAAEEEVISRKIAWKNIMKEMKRKRIVKERAASARFKNFRTTSTRQLEEELKILHKFDKSGLRNWRVKESLAVIPDDADDFNIKMNFEKTFMNIRPEKGHSPSPPTSRIASRDEGERSFIDDASYHSVFENGQSRAGKNRQSDAFWIDFNKTHEDEAVDSHWPSTVYRNDVSTDSATSVPEEEEEEEEESEEDEPIRTIIPQIPHPAPIAWPGKQAQNEKNRPFHKAQQAIRHYSVESQYGPQTDIEESSPDTSSLMDDIVCERKQPTSLKEGDAASAKASETKTAEERKEPKQQTIQQQPSQKPIVFDDSEISNEQSEHSSKITDQLTSNNISAVSSKPADDDDFSSTHSVISVDSMLDDANNDANRRSEKRNQGQRLPSMSSLGASTQTSELTNQSGASQSDFEEVSVPNASPDKQMQLKQIKDEGLLSYPSLSSSSSSSSSKCTTSSLSSPSPDHRISRQPIKLNESTTSLQSSDQSIESLPSTASSKLSDLHEAIQNLDVLQNKSQSVKVGSSSSSTDSSSPGSSLSSAQLAKYQQYLAASNSPVKSLFRKSFPERFDTSEDEDNNVSGIFIPQKAKTATFSLPINAETSNVSHQLNLSISKPPSAPSMPSGSSTGMRKFREQFDSSDDEDNRVPINKVVSQRPVGSEKAAEFGNETDAAASLNLSQSKPPSAPSIPSGSSAKMRKFVEDDSETSIDYRAVTLNKNGSLYDSARLGADKRDIILDSSSSSSSPVNSVDASQNSSFANDFSSNILKQVTLKANSSVDLGMDLSSYVPSSKQTQKVAGLDLSDTMDSVTSNTSGNIGRAIASTTQDRLLMPTGATAVGRTSSHEKTESQSIGLSINKPPTASDLYHATHQSTAAEPPQVPAKSSAISPPPQISAAAKNAPSVGLVTSKNTLLPNKQPTSQTSSHTFGTVNPLQVEDSDSSAELDRHIAQLSLNLDTSSQVSQRLLQGSTLSNNTDLSSKLVSKSSSLLQGNLLDDSEDEDLDMDEDSISGGSSSIHHLSAATSDNQLENNNTSLLRSSSLSNVQQRKPEQTENVNDSLLNSTIMTTSSMTRSGFSGNNRSLPLEASSSSLNGVTPSTSFLTGDGDQPSYLYSASNATLSEIQHEIYDMRRRLLHAVSYPQATVNAQLSLLNSNANNNQDISMTSSPISSDGKVNMESDEDDDIDDNYIQSVLRSASVGANQSNARDSVPPSMNNPSAPSPVLRPTMVHDDDMSSDDSMLHFENEIKRRKAQQQEEIARKQAQRQQVSGTAVATLDSSIEDSIALDSRFYSNLNQNMNRLSNDEDRKNDADDEVMLTEQSLSSQSTPRKYRVDSAVVTSNTSGLSNTTHSSIQYQQRQQQQQHHYSTSSSYILQENSLESSQDSDDSATFMSMLQQQTRQATVALPDTSAATKLNTVNNARRVTIADTNNTYHSPPSSMLLSEQSLSISPMTPSSTRQSRLQVQSTPSDDTDFSEAPTPKMTAYSSRQIQYNNSTMGFFDYDHSADDSSDLDILAALSPTTPSTAPQHVNRTSVDPLNSTQQYSRLSNGDLISSRNNVSIVTGTTQNLRSYSNALATDYTSILRRNQQVTSSLQEQQQQQRQSSSSSSALNMDIEVNYDPLEHEQVLVEHSSPLSYIDPYYVSNRQQNSSARTSNRNAVVAHLPSTQLTAIDEDSDDDDDVAFERDLQRTMQFIRGDRGSGVRAGRTSHVAFEDDSDVDADESSFDLLEEQSF